MSEFQNTTEDNTTDKIENLYTLSTEKDKFLDYVKGSELRFFPWGEVNYVYAPF